MVAGLGRSVLFWIPNVSSVPTPAGGRDETCRPQSFCSWRARTTRNDAAMIGIVTAAAEHIARQPRLSVRAVAKKLYAGALMTLAF